MKDLMNISGKLAIVTGGTGVLGSEIACALAEEGVNIVIVDRNTQVPDEVKTRMDQARGNVEIVFGDVLDREVLQKTGDDIIRKYKKIDILVNAAGGNHPGATTGPDQSFFDLDLGAFRKVLDLNLTGTVLPCQIFGRYMADAGEGVILNVSSMNAFRPLTKIPAYSAGKAGVSNFTQWLAVHMAQEYSSNIRVNAIAPGFFLTEQNRFLLTDKQSGELTPRGNTIKTHTPMGRFGDPDDLLGTILWLLSPASRFVTGIIVPVDGGFSAFSGV